MACMICPKPICLELRLVSDKNENVADLTMENHTSHGPKQIPVGPIDMEIYVRKNHPIDSPSYKQIFKPGEPSLFIHNVYPYPSMIVFPMQEYNNLTSDPLNWTPLKRGAVQIGNRQLQESKAGQLKSDLSWARKTSLTDDWGYELITYERDIPFLDIHKLTENGEQSKHIHSKTILEMDKRYGSQEPLDIISIKYAKIGKKVCPICGNPLYRLLIELRGITSLRPRLHMVENWPTPRPPLRIGTTFVEQPQFMPLFDARHRDNALNLAVYSALAYACLEQNSTSSYLGSIGNFFDCLDHGLAHSLDEPAPKEGMVRDLASPLIADTLPAKMYLERIPYGKGYLLEDIQFFYDKDADAEGFAACDAETAIFAFRGTSSLKDILTDISISAKKDTDILGNLHQGFLHSVNALKEQVLNYSNQKNVISKKIFVCGHSLGGAMATLMSFILQKELRKPIVLYTYGSPRSGDEAFVQEMMKSNIVHYRIVNHNDAVPRVPFNKFQKNLLGGISIILDAYLHYGNFCHLLQLQNYEAMIVHVSSGQEFLSPLLLSDMSTTGDLESINPINWGGDHPVGQYFNNILKAIEQREMSLQIQMTEYQQRLDTALRRQKMQRCHP